MKRIILILCLFCLLIPSGAFTAEGDASLPLSLNECIEIILANNPDLAMAKADIESKEAALQSSQKDLYPTLSAQYSYAHQPDQFFSPADLFTYGFKAEQPLYKGKALVTSVKQAELSLGTSRLALEQLVNNLVFEIYGRYYELLRAVKLEEEAQQSVLRLQSHLKDAKAFYDAGLIPKNDMLQSEVELAQGEQDMVDAENSTALSRSRLNVLMERAVDTLFAIEDSTEYAIQNINWDEVIAKARESRAEIAQAEMSVRIAENDIVLAKAPYLPAVTLSASYDWLGDDLGLSHEPGAPREMKTIMAVASWKLWTWRKDSDDVLAAGKNLRRVQKSVAKTVNEVTLDARNSFLRLEQAAKRIKVSEKAIEHAKENFRINQAQYQAQLTTSTDVLDAQTLLSQAMTNYYDALYGYQLALAAIDKSKGLFGQLYVK